MSNNYKGVTKALKLKSIDIKLIEDDTYFLSFRFIDGHVNNLISSDKTEISYWKIKSQDLQN